MEEYGPVFIFTSGDWCREHAADLAGSGGLDAVKLVVKAGTDFYEKSDGERGEKPMAFIYDSVRGLEEAQELIQYALGQGIAPEEIYTIHLKASLETCLERITERLSRKFREDDAKPDVVRKRLRVYFGEETPESTDENYSYTGKGGVLNEIAPYLKTNTNYHEVDGDEDLEMVRSIVKLHLIPAVMAF
jgi:adenylate kinase family enzyme